MAKTASRTRSGTADSGTTVRSWSPWRVASTDPSAAYSTDRVAGGASSRPSGRPRWPLAPPAAPRSGPGRSGPCRSPAAPPAGGAGPGGRSRSRPGGQRGRLDREGEGEGAARPDDALGPDAAAVGLDQLPAEGQAEPAAAAGPGPGRVQPIEAVEHPAQMLGGDPGAGVGHGQPGPVGRLPDPDPDRAAGSGELDRVVDQVGDHLGETGPVAEDHGPGRRLHAELEARLLGQGTELDGHPGDDLDQIDRL